MNGSHPHGQYFSHSHSTEHLNGKHLNQNDIQRKPTAYDENHSKFEKIRQHSLRASGRSTSTYCFPKHHSNINGSTNRIADILPPYATVHARQRHYRASILPPGAVSCGGSDVEDTGIGIRRFSSVQLRPSYRNPLEGRRPA